MDWIKKNPEKFVLALLALGLLAVSTLLIKKALDFRQTFAGIRGEVARNNNIPPLDTQAVDSAEAAIEKPAKWGSHPGSLLVSRRYIIKDGQPYDPSEDTSQPLHPPVPNGWFIENNLDLLNPGIIDEDPDGDGFTNLDEWQGKTDPNNKDAHPPYHTKLRLVQFVREPFRLIFKAMPDADSFQIDTVDIRQPTQILKVGALVAGTKFKLIKFEPKSVVDENGVEKDISELTLENVETGAKVVLIKEKLVNSPDSFAQFKYTWDGTEFKVRKDGDFTLKPQPDLKYKLIDITETQAVIQLEKTGEKITVPHL
jgi:hypothetical protein